MSTEEPSAPSDDTHSLAFEISSPGCLTLAQTLLTALNENDGINRISLEVESSDPFTALPQTLTASPNAPESAESGDDTASQPVRANGGTVTEPADGPETEMTAADAPAAPNAQTAPETPTQSTLEQASTADPAAPDDTATDALPETDAPDTSTDASDTADDTDDDADPEANEDASEYVCDCGDAFDSTEAYNGHQRWCDGEEDDAADDADTTETAADTTDTADETTDQSLDATAYDLKVGTWKYKIASTFYHRDERMTHRDLAEALRGTEWENDKANLSRTMSDMEDEGLLARQEREMNHHGSNPYEYWLTDPGTRVVEDAEETARADGDPTYETLIDEADTDDVADEDEDEDVADAADAEATDSDGDTVTDGSVESETATTDTADTAETVSDDADTDADTAAEAADESDTDTDAEAETETDDDTPDISIQPGTRKFKAASALYHSSKPTTAKDLAERLERTEWEQDSSNLSADLGDLHAIGVADREQRATERGNPYEYELTETGEEVAEHAIEAAKEDDEYTTYEEVITGK